MLRHIVSARSDKIKRVVHNTLVTHSMPQIVFSSELILLCRDRRLSTHLMSPIMHHLCLALARQLALELIHIHWLRLRHSQVYGLLLDHLMHWLRYMRYFRNHPLLLNYRLNRLVQVVVHRLAFNCRFFRFTLLCRGFGGRGLELVPLGGDLRLHGFALGVFVDLSLFDCFGFVVVAGGLDFAVLEGLDCCVVMVLAESEGWETQHNSQYGKSRQLWNGWRFTYCLSRSTTVCSRVSCSRLTVSCTTAGAISCSTVVSLPPVVVVSTFVEAAGADSCWVVGAVDFC
jgi:hypothetical protein